MCLIFACELLPTGIDFSQTLVDPSISVTIFHISNDYDNPALHVLHHDPFSHRDHDKLHCEVLLWTSTHEAVDLSDPEFSFPDILIPVICG